MPDEILQAYLSLSNGTKEHLNVLILELARKYTKKGAVYAVGCV